MGQLKVNDIVEVVGVLGIDPESTMFMDEKWVWSSKLIPSDADFVIRFARSSKDTVFYEEKMAHHPPSSLVARLHCICVQKLDHSNPLIPQPAELETGSRVLRHCSAIGEASRKLMDVCLSASICGLVRCSVCWYEASSATVARSGYRICGLLPGRRHPGS